MARKVDKNLVALGSAAILAVYGAGLIHTASSVSATDSSPAQAIAAAALAQPPGGPALASAPGAAPVTAVPALAVSTGATAAVYQDGTYTGTGTSRFGNITVAVTVQGGKITAVNLTKVTTSYPASRIAGLPGQVVVRQSAGVDLVSGATYSSRAFKDAVTQALAQANGSTRA